MQGEQRVALVQFLVESSKRKLGVSSVFWNAETVIYLQNLQMIYISWNKSL